MVSFGVGGILWVKTGEKKSVSGWDSPSEGRVFSLEQARIQGFPLVGCLF